MEKENITNKERYNEVMKEIELLLQKATHKGGYDTLSKKEKARLV